MQLIAIAREMLSGDYERGINPEYERAIVELISAASGIEPDERESLAELIWQGV